MWPNWAEQVPENYNIFRSKKIFFLFGRHEAMYFHRISDLPLEGTLIKRKSLLPEKFLLKKIVWGIMALILSYFKVFNFLRSSQISDKTFFFEDKNYLKKVDHFLDSMKLNGRYSDYVFFLRSEILPRSKLLKPMMMTMVKIFSFVFLFLWDCCEKRCSAFFSRFCWPCNKVPNHKRNQCRKNLSGQRLIHPSRPLYECPISNSTRHQGKMICLHLNNFTNS